MSAVKFRDERHRRERFLNTFFYLPVLGYTFKTFSSGLTSSHLAMSHASKSKAKGISATSFFDLKAELSKHEADFAKAKAAGKSTAIVGGVKRPDKVS